MMIRDELSKIGREGMLPAGAVLCGGGVKIPGAVDLARDSLLLPVQLGFPNDIEGIVDRVDDPSFTSSVGLLQFGHRYGSQGNLLDFDFKKMFGSFSTFFKKLLP
jgi:cell division protein FtsA